MEEVSEERLSMAKKANCLQKDIVQSYASDSRSRRSPWWTDDISGWTGLPVNKATRITDNHKEWRNVATAYLHGGLHWQRQLCTVSNGAICSVSNSSLPKKMKVSSRSRTVTYIVNVVVFQNRCKIETFMQQTTNRKWYFWPVELRQFRWPWVTSGFCLLQGFFQVGFSCSCAAVLKISTDISTSYSLSVIADLCV